MFHRFESMKVGEYRFEIFVREALVNHEGHDVIQLADLDGAGAHDLQEKGLVIVGNAGGIGSEVGRGDVAPWTQNHRQMRGPGISWPLSRGGWQSLQPAKFTRKAPRLAGSNADGISGTGEFSGLGTPRINYLTGKMISVRGNWLRTGGSEILVGHFPVVGVRHHGKKGTAVVADAFANGTGKLIVGPAADTGFGIGSEIGSDDATGEIRPGINSPAPSMPGT
jgi:hypothetical protein